MKLKKMVGWTMIRLNAPGKSDDGEEWLWATKDLPHRPGDPVNGHEGTWWSHHDVYMDEEERVPD